MPEETGGTAEEKSSPHPDEGNMHDPNQDE